MTSSWQSVPSVFCPAAPAHLISFTSSTCVTCPGGLPLHRCCCLSLLISREESQGVLVPVSHTSLRGVHASAQVPSVIFWELQLVRQEEASLEICVQGSSHMDLASLRCCTVASWIFDASLNSPSPGATPLILEEWSCNLALQGSGWKSSLHLLPP